jgi:cation/acetate symporter
VFTLVYIVICTADKVLPFLFEAPILRQEQWLLGISPQGIGTLGMVLNFVVTLVISSFTAPPPQDVLDLIERVRVPGDVGAAGKH